MKAPPPRPREIQPPSPANNRDMEARLLGSVMVYPDLLDLVREPLTFSLTLPLQVRPFYIEAHQTVWNEICALADRGQIPELETLIDELKRTKRLEEVGEPFLIELVQTAPQDPSFLSLPEHREQVVEQWAKRLRDYAIRRACGPISQLAVNIAYSAHADVGDAREQVTKLAQMSNALLSSSAAGSRFRLMSDEEVESLEPARGILGNVLFEDSIAFLYGRPGRWKSFVAIDWGLSIATEHAWHGRPVVGGDVVYIAAEGARSIGARIRAWKQYHGVTGRTRFKVLGVPVHLLDPEQVLDLCATIRAQTSDLRLVMIDTLARSMAGGDENATKDANAVFDAADIIKREFGSCVLLIHHTGKDGAKGMRGNSAFLGNADTVIRVASDDRTDGKERLEVGETITLISEKPKDAEPFADIRLTTERVALASDTSDLRTSLVITPTTAAARPASRPARLTVEQQQALDVLRGSPTGLRWSTWREFTGFEKDKFNNIIRALDRTHRLIRLGQDTLYHLVAPTPTTDEV